MGQEFNLSSYVMTNVNSRATKEGPPDQAGLYQYSRFLKVVVLLQH